MLSFSDRLSVLGSPSKEDNEDLIDHLLKKGLYRIVKTKEEALTLCEDGDKVGIGYYNSHIVYRVNVNREVKTLSYQYIIC